MSAIATGALIRIRTPVANSRATRLLSERRWDDTPIGPRERTAIDRVNARR